MCRTRLLLCVLAVSGLSGCPTDTDVGRLEVNDTLREACPGAFDWQILDMITSAEADRLAGFTLSEMVPYFLDEECPRFCADRAHAGSWGLYSDDPNDTQCELFCERCGLAIIRQVWGGF
jgi:hypothetical protein